MDITKTGWDFRFLVTLAAIFVFAGCNSKSPEPVQLGKTNNQDVPAKTQPTDGLATSKPTKTSSPKPDTADITEEEIDAYLPPDLPPLTLLWIQPVKRGGHVIAHPDGRSFIHAGERLARWNIGESEPVVVYLSDSPVMESIGISPEGNKLFTGDSEGKLCVWDTSTGELLLSKQHSKNSISGLAVSPNSESIAVCDEADSVAVYDASTLEKKTSFKTQKYGTSKLFFVDDDVLVAMGSRSTEVWNLTTQSRLATLNARTLYLTEPKPGGGEFLYLPKNKNTLKKWPTEVDSKISLDGMESNLRSLICSQDGTLMSLASQDRINIFDVQSCKRIQAIDMHGGGKAFHATAAGMSWMPKRNLLVVATASGLLRVMGTPESGKALGLEPIHSDELSPPPRPQQLPTTSEFRRVIDLRTLPKLPCVRSNILVTDNSDGLLYQTPSTIGNVRTFYRHLLSKQGWAEVIPEKLSLFDIEFRKDGFGLHLRTSPSRSRRDDDTSRTQVSLALALHDDIDTKSLLPVLKDATEIEESELPYHLSYRTQAKLFEIEIELLKALSTAGWIFTDHSQTSHALVRKDKDFRQLTFLQDGCSLRVHVSPDRTAGGGKRVAYFLNPGGATSTIPIPTDCHGIELPFSTRSNQSVEELTAFYDSRLKIDGWHRIEQEQPSDRKVLRYTLELNELKIELSQLNSGETQIASSSRREWEGLAGIESGIEAADVPTINAASFPIYSGSDIVFETESSFKVLRDIYVTKLKHLGWSLARESSNSMNFKNDNELLPNPKWKPRTISIKSKPKEDRFQITISGKGLRWMKLVPRETPFNLSYSIWLRSKGYPVALDHLDEFGNEMKAIQLQAISEE